MATLSTAFLKPAGWFLAYSGILALVELSIELMIQCVSIVVIVVTSGGRGVVALVALVAVAV
jgi:hypothetical protein